MEEEVTCDCKFGDFCPHFGRLLIGMAWELFNRKDATGRRTRQIWAAEVVKKQQEQQRQQQPLSPPTFQPPMQTINVDVPNLLPPKPCNCGKK